jgi:hypothetical protein
LPFRTSLTSSVNTTPSGGIYPAVPSKCQQRAFHDNLTALNFDWRISRSNLDTLTAGIRKIVGEPHAILLTDQDSAFSVVTSSGRVDSRQIAWVRQLAPRPRMQ